MSLLKIAEKEDIRSKAEKEFIPIAEHRGKHLIVRVWSGEKGTPHMLSKRKVPFGMPEVSFKIGGKKRLYKINYEADGVIKQEGKFLFYDTTFYNQTGALRYYEYPENLDSEEAYTVFKNNGVNMYVKKGGITMMVLMIILGIAAAGVIGMVIMGPYVANANSQHDSDAKNLVTLSGKIDALRAQILNMGAKPVT